MFLFTEYSGPEHFIRAIKGIFQQGWWATEVAEITRTAGTRAILQPTVTALDPQLKDTLGSGADDEVSAVSTATLQQIVAQFDEIVKGLRAVELATLAAKYEGIAMAVTKHLINSPTSSIDGARVDCAFKMARCVWNAFVRIPSARPHAGVDYLGYEDEKLKGSPRMHRAPVGNYPLGCEV